MSDSQRESGHTWVYDFVGPTGHTRHCLACPRTELRYHDRPVVDRSHGPKVCPQVEPSGGYDR